ARRLATTSSGVLTDPKRGPPQASRIGIPADPAWKRLAATVTPVLSRSAICTGFDVLCDVLPAIATVASWTLAATAPAAASTKAESRTSNLPVIGAGPEPSPTKITAL